MIWEYTVVIVEPIEIKKWHSQVAPSVLRSGRCIHTEDDQRRVRTVFSVALVCQQIYSEVTPIYYNQNVFSTDFGMQSSAEAKGLYSFLEAIGGTNTSFIHQLEINFIRSSSHAEFRRALDASQSLSSLIHLNAFAMQSLIPSLPTMNLTAYGQKFMSVRLDGLAEIFYNDRCERRTFAESYDTLPQSLKDSLRS